MCVLLVARVVFLSSRRVAVLFVVPDARYSYTMVLPCDDLYQYLLYGTWNIAAWCCIDVCVYCALMLSCSMCNSLLEAWSRINPFGNEEGTVSKNVTVTASTTRKTPGGWG